MAMRKYLTQAMVRGAIERLEEAARTAQEFAEVVELLDKLEARVQAAYEKTVWSTDSRQFSWNLFSAKSSEKSQDILQTLFTCICQMHNLVEDDELSILIEKAPYKQKVVFFFRFIRGCSPQKIASCLGVTDRNVRDMTAKMLTKIQNGLYNSLAGKRDENIPLTGREMEFLDTYKPKQNKKAVRGNEVQ